MAFSLVSQEINMLPIFERLMSDEAKYAKYSLPDFCAYRDEIAGLRDNQDLRVDRDANKAFIDFYNKKFADEISPVGIICRHVFGENQEGVTVQWIKNDPPDFKIWCDSPVREIFVECTTARDRRLEQYCIEQNRIGNFTSMSGHTSAAISGSRRKGYEFEGEPVEAEFLGETVEKHCSNIEKVIQKKLGSNWQGSENWLCITVPDNEAPGWLSDVVGQKQYDDGIKKGIERITSTFRSELIESGISMIWLVGSLRLLVAHSVHQTCT
jgi:hypothetical protein